MNEFSVQISADLVDRLVNDGENTKRKPRRTRSKVPRESAQPQIKVNKKLLHDDSETHKASAAPGWPVENPLFFPATQPVQSVNAELDAIRSVIQESEKVLDKLQKQESEMVQEVTGRAKELRDKEFKLPYQKPMPCLADYDACLACYKKHANNILKCAPLAKSYYDCVEKAKHQMSSSDK